MSWLAGRPAPASDAHKQAAMPLITGVANDVPAQYAQLLWLGSGGLGGELNGKTGAVNSPTMASTVPPPPSAATRGRSPGCGLVASPPKVATPLPSDTKSPLLE